MLDLALRESRCGAVSWEGSLSLRPCHRPAYWSHGVIGMYEPVSDRWLIGRAPGIAATGIRIVDAGGEELDEAPARLRL